MPLWLLTIRISPPGRNPGPDASQAHMEISKSCAAGKTFIWLSRKQKNYLTWKIALCIHPREIIKLSFSISFLSALALSRFCCLSRPLFQASPTDLKTQQREINFNFFFSLFALNLNFCIFTSRVMTFIHKAIRRTPPKREWQRKCIRIRCNCSLARAFSAAIERVGEERKALTIWLT